MMNGILSALLEAAERYGLDGEHKAQPVDAQREPARWPVYESGYAVAYLGGRCSDGASRDAGRLFHALAGNVSPNSYVGGAALCGQRPGRRSYGWAEPWNKDSVVTCPRCRARMGGEHE